MHYVIQIWESNNLFCLSRGQKIPSRLLLLPTPEELRSQDCVMTPVKLALLLNSGTVLS